MRCGRSRDEVPFRRAQVSQPLGRKRAIGQQVGVVRGTAQRRIGDGKRRQRVAGPATHQREEGEPVGGDRRARIEMSCARVAPHRGVDVARPKLVVAARYQCRRNVSAEHERRDNEADGGDEEPPPTGQLRHARAP